MCFTCHALIHAGLLGVRGTGRAQLNWEQPRVRFPRSDAPTRPNDWPLLRRALPPNKPRQSSSSGGRSPRVWTGFADTDRDWTTGRANWVSQERKRAIEFATQWLPRRVVGPRPKSTPSADRRYRNHPLLLLRCAAPNCQARRTPRSSDKRSSATDCRFGFTPNERTSPIASGIPRNTRSATLGLLPAAPSPSTSVALKAKQGDRGRGRWGCGEPPNSPESEIKGARAGPELEMEGALAGR